MTDVCPQRFGLGARSIVVLTIAVSMLLSVSVLPAASLPSSSDFGPAIDAYASYEAPEDCLTTEQPGVKEFRSLLQDRYGANSGGILRACHIGGPSDHKEGRAYDWMLDANDAADRAKADEVLDWLLATDEHGNAHAMARRLGISYIIWDHEWWASWRPNDGWRPYTGAHPHDDHIHFSFSWAGAKQETSFWTGGGPFVDVPQGRYYTEPVAWMVEHEITDGVGDSGRFEPDMELSRAHMSTFIWRMMDRPTGSPDPGFPDVPSATYYTEAVAWMAEHGITDGWGNTGRFEPHRRVTRDQMAAFLWRTAGRPPAPEPHDFPDVASGAYYDEAVAWLAAHEITDGWGDTGRYEPERVVTRAQAAAFLYRLAHTEAAWSDAPTIPSTVGF